VEQKMSDLPLTRCQICDSEVERRIGMPTIFLQELGEQSLYRGAIKQVILKVSF
jgi:predicted nucleic acid-binding Zn ribbon protein